MSDIKILAVIPARGGSKGILGKNIRPFAGKPLIAHTIEVAKNSPSVDRVIVSTDSEEIATVAKQFGAEVPFLRPAEFASDTSKVADAVVHLLETLQATEEYTPTHVLLLQPTNPLRTVVDIEQAVALMKERNADNVISLCPTETLLLTKDVDDRITILNTEHTATGNRQQLPQYYRLDGCMIYLIETDLLRKERNFLAGAPVGYEIEPWRAVDIDEPADFVSGELLFAHQEELARKIQEFN